MRDMDLLVELNLVLRKSGKKNNFRMANIMKSLMKMMIHFNIPTPSFYTINETDLLKPGKKDGKHDHEVTEVHSKNYKKLTSVLNPERILLKSVNKSVLKSGII